MDLATIKPRLVNGYHFYYPGGKDVEVWKSGKLVRTLQTNGATEDQINAVYDFLDSVAPE